LSAAAGFALQSSLTAKSRLGKSQVSVITDETGATQYESLLFAKTHGLQWVTLRHVPETKKEFASLSAAELKGYAAEFQANKLKVSLLKTALVDKDGFAAAVSAAQAFGAGKIGVRIETARAIDDLAPLAESAKIRMVIEGHAAHALRAMLDSVPSKWVGFSWDPWGDSPWQDAYALLPKARMFNVAARSESLSDGPDQLNWRAIMEALQRDGFQGEICLETGRSDGTFEKASDSLGNLLHIAGEVG
jgi:sugar phosphate isomerase/epimerase